MSWSDAPSNCEGTFCAGLAAPFSRSFRAAALAAAICSLKTEDEDFAAPDAGTLLLDVKAGFSFFCKGVGASPNVGRAFGGRAETLLKTCGFDGDKRSGDCGTAGLEGWSLVVDAELALRRLPPGVKPNPPTDVRDACLAVAGVFFTDGRGGRGGTTKPPSLVPGLLLMLLARLMLDPGRVGGPIGLSAEKKLDRRRSRLSFGVVGMEWRLSTALSDRDGRDAFRAFGVSTSCSKTGS
jgi:hypothetical protein